MKIRWCDPVSSTGLRQCATLSRPRQSMAIGDAFDDLVVRP